MADKDMLRKKCSRCSSKIPRKYNFCPFCGCNSLNESEHDKADYGFLGKNDFDNNMDSMFNNLPVNKIFRAAMKMTEKMMKEMESKEAPKEHNDANMDIQFFINGKRVAPQKGVRPARVPTPPRREFPREKAEKISQLPKKEPASKMMRMGEKIIYELDVPGVETIEDILINRLESSIEIRALTKDHVYSKTLNINLPILRYKLSNGSLTLELQAK
jgi:HSP20 family molecular chaperone IbpA